MSGNIIIKEFKYIFGAANNTLFKAWTIIWAISIVFAIVLMFFGVIHGLSEMLFMALAIFAMLWTCIDAQEKDRRERKKTKEP